MVDSETRVTMSIDISDKITEEEGARLARYVAGRCTPQEAEEVRAWVAADPARAEYLESLRRTWKLTTAAPPGNGEVDDAWEGVLRRRLGRLVGGIPERAGDGAEGRGVAEEVAPIQPQAAPVIPRWPVRRWALRAAAVIALVVVGASGWLAYTRQAPDSPRPVAMREYATDRARRAEIRLKDGTRVLLSVESRLRVPMNYGKRTRDVYLDGEALFEVEHNEKRPFRVHVPGAVAEDLGTIFGVRGYPDGSPVRVVVAEGVVEVQATSSMQPPAAYRLDPGHLAHVSGDGTVQVERGVDPADYLAFADGRLVFKDTPLRLAAAQLSRWYDLDVRLADPMLASIPLTASFQDEPVTTVLDLISLSLGVHYERDGKVVMISR